MVLQLARFGVHGAQQLRRAAVGAVRSEAHARAAARAFVVRGEEAQDGVEAGVGAHIRTGGAVGGAAVRGHVQPGRAEQVGAGIGAQAERARARDQHCLPGAEHVEQGGGAGAQTLQQGQLGGVADFLLRHNLGGEVAERHQQGEDDVPREVTRGDVVGQAPEQRRGERVVVQVDQARQGETLRHRDAPRLARHRLRRDVEDGAVGADHDAVAVAQAMRRAPGPPRLDDGDVHGLDGRGARTPWQCGGAERHAAPQGPLG
jgi:hypothetical protein